MIPLDLERGNVLPQSCLLATNVPLAEPNVLSRLVCLHIVPLSFGHFLDRTWLLSPSIAPMSGGRKRIAFEKEGAKLTEITSLPLYVGR